MDTPFFCPDCGREHDEPADARLGHLVPCFDCALEAREQPAVREAHPAIAA
jgi:hypothetical protein